MLLYVLDVATFDIQPVIQNKGPPNEETVLGLVGETVKLQCVFSGRCVYYTICNPSDRNESDARNFMI